jgi:uncharacterized protein
MRRFRRCPVVAIGFPRGGVVEARVAIRFAARLLGLAWVSPRPGRGLLIPRCASVHTFGMREPIDVVFAARAPGGLVVLAVHPCVPRRCLLRGPGGRNGAVLELARGEAERLGARPGALVRVSGWAL